MPTTIHSLSVSRTHGGWVSRVSRDFTVLRPPGFFRSIEYLGPYPHTHTHTRPYTILCALFTRFFPAWGLREPESTRPDRTTPRYCYSRNIYVYRFNRFSIRRFLTPPPPPYLIHSRRLHSESFSALLGAPYLLGQRTPGMEYHDVCIHTHAVIAFRVDVQILKKIKYKYTSLSTVKRLESIVVF